MGRASEGPKTSLDVLRREDRTLLDLFERIGQTRKSTVDTRYDYGNSAKEIIRHMAVRQSSLMDVALVSSDVPDLHTVGARMRDRGTAQRTLIDQVADMSRGIQGISLNQGQDFDGPLHRLIEEVSHEIEWELSEAIPLIERTLPTGDGIRHLKSARYVERHAPTKVNPSGPRWYENAPVVSRLLTVYSHLRNHPRAYGDDRAG
jgi:hypothetical protein